METCGCKDAEITYELEGRKYCADCLITELAESGTIIKLVSEECDYLIKK